MKVKRETLLIGLFFFLLLFLFRSPTTFSQTIPTWRPLPTTHPRACKTNGQTRCVSKAIYEKCIGRQWVIVKNCAQNNQVCVEGIGCTDQPNTCNTPGQIACHGKAVIMCISGQWQVISRCATNEFCLDINGRCTYVPPQCNYGQKKCEGNNYLECKNQYWYLIEDCSLKNKTCTTNGCLGQAPTYVPPTSTSCQKSQGDANCDGKIDMVDFENWKKEYLGEAGTKTADFNKDGKVGLVDFERWRKGFLAPQLRPTATQPPEPTVTEAPQPTVTQPHEPTVEPATEITPPKL